MLFPLLRIELARSVARNRGLNQEQSIIGRVGIVTAMAAAMQPRLSDRPNCLDPAFRPGNIHDDAAFTAAGRRRVTDVADHRKPDVRAAMGAVDACAAML